MYSLILAVAVRYTYPLLLLFAAFLFLKGHNSPGGGFIAGLLTAAAIVLSYIASKRSPGDGPDRFFVNLIGFGLCVALTTAAVPVFLGYPFFTHTFGFVDVPLLGKVELASASLFDLGVYMVVVGNVVTVIRAMTGQ